MSEQEPGAFQLDGKTFRMSQLGGGDIMELDAWIRARILQTPAAGLSPDVPDRVLRAAMDSAIERALGASLMTPSGREVLESLEGVSQLVFVGLRRQHRELKREDVIALMIQDGAVDLAMGEFRAMNPNLFSEGADQ